jgi:hypothetical protein
MCEILEEPLKSSRLSPEAQWLFEKYNSRLIELGQKLAERDRLLVEKYKNSKKTPAP